MQCERAGSQVGQPASAAAASGGSSTGPGGKVEAGSQRTQVAVRRRTNDLRVDEDQGAKTTHKR